MSIIDRFLKRQNAPQKDITEPPPSKGAARFFFLMATHFPKMLTLNLLFLLFCLPIVTIPAALSGMSRVCMLLMREGVCFVWTDFFSEFKASFLKSIPIFLFNAFWVVSAYFCFLYGQNNGELSFVLFAFAVLFLIFGLLLSCYTFAMQAICRLRNADIIRNAISLIFLEPKTDLLLLLCVGGFFAVFIGFLPYSAPIILFGIFSVACLMMCVIVYEPLKKRILLNSPCDSSSKA